MATLHINKPGAVGVWIERGYCPTCKKRRAFVRSLYSWHGLRETCLRCGEMWADGEQLPRPFAPRWREQNKNHARKTWRNAGPSRVKNAAEAVDRLSAKIEAEGVGDDNS